MSNSITIMVPWIPILTGLGVISVFLIIRKGMRLRSRKREQQEAGRREEIQCLFPSPWDEAYERLIRIDDNPDSRVFLRYWLSEHTDLPRLSREAVHRLACQLTFEYCDIWDECLDILSPYSDVKSLAETERVAQEKAEQLAQEKEFAEKKALFPCPWDLAYETCRSSDTWKGTQLWLQKWIGEQINLPPISLKAVEELMTKVVEDKDDENEEYLTFFALITPYLDTGCAPNKSQSASMEKHTESPDARLARESIDVERWRNRHWT